MFTDNIFIRERESGRSLRLDYVSKKIAEVAAELQVSGGLLDWAVNAKTSYDEVYYAYYFENMEKKHALTDSRNADKALIEIYQLCKNILFSRFKDDDKLQLFGISGTTPRKHNDITTAAEIMLKANSDLATAGEPDILPENLRIRLQNCFNDSVQFYYEIGKKTETAAKSARILKEKFEADSKNLRILYNLAVAVWGKENYELTMLGFAVDNKKRGRKRKGKPEEETIEKVTALPN